MMFASDIVMYHLPMRISDFTLRDLRTFCAVVDHSGFLAAQAVLGMSQPAISAHIRDLETGLGFTLCRRGRSGFALTEKGKLVYDYAKAMLSGIEDCSARLNALRSVLSGPLRIGIVDSEANNPDLPLHRAISRFFAREQEVQLSLDIGTPEALAKGLQNDELHVAIGPFPNRQPNIRYLPIYTEEHALYCGRHHPLFSVSDDEITRTRLAEHAMTVRPYLQRAELQGLDAPRVTASVSNMEGQAILIRSGCFLGFLPVHFAATWVSSGEMRKLSLPGLGWLSQFYVALRTNPEPSDLTKAFVQDVVDELLQGGTQAGHHPTSYSR